MGRFRSRGFSRLKDRAANNTAEINRIREAQLAQESVPSLTLLYDALSDQLAGADAVFNGSNELTKALLTSLLIFGEGLGVATECRADGGWDTHEDGESAQIQLLTQLNDSLMSLWEMAEKLGVAEKLIVVVSSDFGRTPYYNSYGGKDHWPINSYIIMQGGVQWTNRVVGKTDNLQNAMPINPKTLQIDSSKSLIYPKHVHHALHHYLGISEFADSFGFGFGAETLFDFFNPAIAT